MQRQQLLFSDNKKYRIRRHLLFWVLWALYFTSSHTASPFLGPEDSGFRNIPFTATEGFLTVLCIVPICYLTLYLIIPLYTKNRKAVKATLLLVISWAAYYYLFDWVQQHLFPPVLEAILPQQYLPQRPRPAAVQHFMSLLALFLGGVSTTAFVGGFSYIKQWYLKEQKNTQLQKENAEAQLQLLTAQVHPHFLFNTLNNIYSQTQTESPRGSKMIMELSELLRYILLEGNKTLVPLQKELGMMQAYIDLEKSRYGNKLDFHLSLPAHTGNLQIAPLLLLPFIENSFRHGYLPAPWVNLKIEVVGSVLTMKLMNGSPDGQEAEPTQVNGMANATKRLELLYPGNYELQINDEPAVFIVNLKLNLGDKGSISTLSKTASTLSYA